MAQLGAALIGLGFEPSRVHTEVFGAVPAITPGITSTSEGPVRSRGVEAGGLEVSSRGPRHVVCARTGQATKILGLVTDTPELAATDGIRTYEQRWTIAPWRTDVQPLRGCGHDQHRPSWAAVTPRHLVCLAEARLTHLRLERHGAQGHRPHHTSADLSTATAPEPLRRVLWEDLMT